MRILFDHGVPAPLRHALADHTIQTAFEMGWSQYSNGDLLNAAETSFDAIVTTDQNLKYQQKLSGRTLAILVLSTTNWPKIEPHRSIIAEAVNGLSEGDFVELSIP